MKSVTVFKRSKDSQGRSIMAFTKLPDGRTLNVTRMGAGGVLAEDWGVDEVMINLSGNGVGLTMYLNAEQAVALAAELMALAADMPGGMQGGVQ